MKNGTNPGMLLLVVAGALPWLVVHAGCSDNVPIGSQEGGTFGTGGRANETGGNDGHAGTSDAGGTGGANGTGGTLREADGGTGGETNQDGGTSHPSDAGAGGTADAGSDAPTGQGGGGTNCVGTCHSDGGAGSATDAESRVDAAQPDGGAKTYPGAYLSWQAPAGAAGTGMAVVVSGEGWMDTWERVTGFEPEQPPSSAAHAYTLPLSQVYDLFSRLEATNDSVLPHTSGWAECYGRLYWRLCESCEAKTINYYRDSQLAPEMESVWSWFDAALPSEATVSNPRAYCPF